MQPSWILLAELRFSTYLTLLLFKVIQDIYLNPNIKKCRRQLVEQQGAILGGEPIQENY